MRDNRAAMAGTAERVLPSVVAQAQALLVASVVPECAVCCRSTRRTAHRARVAPTTSTTRFTAAWGTVEVAVAAFTAAAAAAEPACSARGRRAAAAARTWFRPVARPG